MHKRRKTVQRKKSNLFGKYLPDRREYAFFHPCGKSGLTFEMRARWTHCPVCKKPLVIGSRGMDLAALKERA